MYGSGTRKTGFTLIEILVVVAISGVIVLALSTFVGSSLHTTEVLQEYNQSEQTARVALTRIAREASLAKSFSIVQSQRLKFICPDITGDGEDDEVEYRYYVATDVLKRTLNGTAEVFATDVTDFSFAYEYETETKVSIAAPGESISFVLGSFDGVGYDLEDYDRLDLWGRWLGQYFLNTTEVPSVESVTIRARRRTDVAPAVDTVVFLHNASHKTLASGRLERHRLTTSYQDLIVPLTWLAGEDTTMQPDTIYHFHVMADGGSSQYAGSISIVELGSAGPALPSGCGLGWNWLGLGINPSQYRSMFYSVRGSLPVTVPTRNEVPVSILKKMKATIEVTEGEHAAKHSRTWKVLNQ